MWYSVANGWVIGNRMQKCFVSDYVKYFTKFQDIDWMDKLHSKTARKNVHGKRNTWEKANLETGSDLSVSIEVLLFPNFC